MTTNEKIKTRLAEVNVWGQLMERLDYIRKGIDVDIEQYQRQIEEGELGSDCWQNEEIDELKIKLAVCMFVEQVILKSIG